MLFDFGHFLNFCSGNNSLSMKSYWFSSVWFFPCVLFSCRTIRTPLNCSLVRISLKKAELLQLKHWGAWKEKQIVSFPVLLGWYQTNAQLFSHPFYQATAVVGMLYVPKRRSGILLSFAFLTLKLWPSCSIHERWSGVPGAIFQIKDTFFWQSKYIARMFQRKIFPVVW